MLAGTLDEVLNAAVDRHGYGCNIVAIPVPQVRADGNGKSMVMTVVGVMHDKNGCNIVAIPVPQVRTDDNGKSRVITVVGV